MLNETFQITVRNKIYSDDGGKEMEEFKEATDQD